MTGVRCSDLETISREQLGGNSAGACPARQKGPCGWGVSAQQGNRSDMMSAVEMILSAVAFVVGARSPRMSSAERLLRGSLTEPGYDRVGSDADVSPPLRTKDSRPTISPDASGWRTGAGQACAAGYRDSRSRLDRAAATAHAGALRQPAVRSPTRSHASGAITSIVRARLARRVPAAHRRVPCGRGPALSFDGRKSRSERDLAAVPRGAASLRRMGPSGAARRAALTPPAACQHPRSL